MAQGIFTSVTIPAPVTQWRTWHTSSGGGGGGQAAASIHFSDGGGVKVRKMPQKKSARFARKVAISNFSRKARGKNENCVCLVYFYVKFNGFVVHDSAFLTYSCITYYFQVDEIIGGGGQNDMFAPPPPQIK